LGEAGPGFGWLVHKARVAVVPIGIAGSADLLPRHASFIRPSVVRVAIGAPLHFDDLWEQADTRAAIREIGSRTMAAIQLLVEQAENDRAAASGHSSEAPPDAKKSAS
jgi:1-acyl-sn-glycerol-3-phosphate acyltransferase